MRYHDAWVRAGQAVEGLRTAIRPWLVIALAFSSATALPARAAQSKQQPAHVRPSSPPPESAHDLLLKGMGCRDLVKGSALVRRAAELGDADAQYRLGMRYHFGLGLPRDPKSSSLWLRKAAGQGHMESQSRLGNDLLKSPLDESRLEGIKWLTKAAEQGDIDSQERLGKLYMQGLVTPRDTDKAVRWLAAAGEGGRGEAAFDLAVYYGAPFDGLPDDTLAAQWYAKAAEAGFARGAYKLGECYENGIGVDRRDDKARACYREALDGGYDDAALKYGLFCQKGRGGPVDASEALRSLLAAARKRDVKAYFALFEMHYYGQGMPVDRAAALTWYMLAHGYQPPRLPDGFQRDLESSLPPEQVALARQRAIDWTKK